MTLRNRLLDLLKDKSPKVYVHILKTKSDLLEELKQSYPGLPIIEALYCCINNTTPPVCELGNKRKFYTLSSGYRKFCDLGNKCTCRRNNQSEKIKNYRKNISEQEKQNQRKKYEQVCLDRYGVPNPTQNTEIRNKQLSTMKNRYGVEYANQSEELKFRKYKNKTGFESPLHNPETHQKTKETYTERYGKLMLHAREELYKKYNGNPFKDSSVKEKIKETLLQKYGVGYPLQNSTFLEKSRNTCLERYGVSNGNQLHISKEAYTILSSKDMFSEIYSNNSIIELMDILNVSKEYIYRKCLEYGIKDKNKSSAESEISKILKENNIYYSQSTRTIIPPKELDFYIPSKNLAIEFCGLYWHSELQGKSKQYHINKLLECNKKGIRLITIFEDEWENKKDICKHRLYYILGIGNKICFARQTQIKEISTQEYKDFCNNYHIQGYVASKIKYGLFYNNNLVAIMGLGKTRRALGSKNKDVFELMRFCSIGNIPGAGSKLFKKFLKDHNPKEVISYCDLRWGIGDFYLNLGFTKLNNTQPNYWYMQKYQTREYRFNWTKGKLVKMGFHKDLTEWEIMQLLGYDRIWDCGHSKWVWKDI